MLYVNMDYTLGAALFSVAFTTVLALIIVGLDKWRRS